MHPVNNQNVYLIEIIETAFSKALFPTTYFQLGVETVGDIQDELQRCILGKDWRAVELADWLNVGAPIGSIVTYVRPEVLAYYLPSLLVATLKIEDRFELAIEALLPNNLKHEPKGDWWSKFQAEFGKIQTRAILSFLERVIVLSPESHLTRTFAEQALLLWRSPLTGVA